MRSRLWSYTLATVVVTLVPAAPAFAQIKTFTANADFESGALNNTADNNPNNALVLGRTPVSKTTLVWVDNYINGYIVRIDSSTGRQTSRFDSALVSINGKATGARPANEYCNFASTGNCPGRVAVDTNGDVWIVNRAFGSQGTLSKFSGNIAHCIDRNNNGVIDTSFDKNGDGVIDVAAGAGEYFGQDDECILTTIPTGAVNAYPRGVAVDKRGKIWVCTYNEGKVYRFNPNEPVSLEASYTIGGNPYSMASGGDYVFASNMGAGGTKRINISTGAVDSVPCPATYGIVASPDGSAAWLGGWDSSYSVYKADFANNVCTRWASPSQLNTAVTLDLAGNIWAAGYSNQTILKYSPAGALLGSYPAHGANPHGLSVAFDGYIWVVNDGQWCLEKIDPNTGASVQQVEIGGPGVPNRAPYLYSDFTGVQIDRQAPYTRVGAWDAEYDSGALNMPWKELSWNTEPEASIPPETSLKVSVRAANTKTELGQTAYTQVTNPASLVGTVGRYIQVKADFAGPGYQTPVLSDLNITGPCDIVNADCCITDNDCSDGDLCTSDVCPAPGGKCASAPILGCCMTEADCNDKNQCTSDTCPVAGAQCAHAPVQNCCMSYADCADSDTCTADVCPSAGGVCSNPVIPGCCHSVADCDDGNGCTSDVCPADGELCEHTPIANCCAKNANCADSNLCTTDVCDLNTKSCKNQPIPDCCNQDSECMSGDTCKTSRCSGLGGVCVSEAIPNCCTDQSPEVGKDCDPPAASSNHLPCKPGQWLCESNALVCKGAVKPSPETCDWIDNDCEGNIDAPKACPIAGEACVDGRCVPPCATGEFPCKPAQQCVNGSCLPTICAGAICEPGTDQVCVAGLCVSADGGVAGTGGAGNTGGTGGSAGTGHSGGSGGVAIGGTGGAPLPDASTEDSGASGASGAGGMARVAMPENYGLATGGGGCSCAVAGDRRTPDRTLIGLAAAIAIGSALRRRARRS